LISSNCNTDKVDARLAAFAEETSTATDEYLTNVSMILDALNKKEEEISLVMKNEKKDGKIDVE
jgi:hypothetical protein